MASADNEHSLLAGDSLRREHEDLEAGLLRAEHDAHRGGAAVMPMGVEKEKTESELEEEIRNSYGLTSTLRFFTWKDCFAYALGLLCAMTFVSLSRMFVCLACCGFVLVFFDIILTLDVSHKPVGLSASRAKCNHRQNLLWRERCLGTRFARKHHRPHSGLVEIRVHFFVYRIFSDSLLDKHLGARRAAHTRSMLKIIAQARSRVL